MDNLAKNHVLQEAFSLIIFLPLTVSEEGVQALYPNPVIVVVCDDAER